MGSKKNRPDTRDRRSATAYERSARHGWARQAATLAAETSDQSGLDHIAGLLQCLSDPWVELRDDLGKPIWCPDDEDQRMPCPPEDVGPVLITARHCRQIRQQAIKGSASRTVGPDWGKRFTK
jgi:hypothetical protein